MEKEEEICEKCKGTGIVKEKDGVHTCFDCLEAGRFDQHSKKVKDSGVKI